jgi:hypothetical protein
VVSPFPWLPLLVELLRVPQADGQATPLLARVQFAPRNCPLLWEIVAVKTTMLEAAIDVGFVSSDRVVVFPPPTKLQPASRKDRRKNREQTRNRRKPRITASERRNLLDMKTSFGFEAPTMTAKRVISKRIVRSAVH